jgi:hypothetical protein
MATFFLALFKDESLFDKQRFEIRVLVQFLHLQKYLKRIYPCDSCRVEIDLVKLIAQ